MTLTRRHRPAPRNPHARVWADLANQVEALRLDLTAAYTATIDTARFGTVSAPHARALITGRTLSSTNTAADALVDLERTLRNEAARLERNAGPR